MLKHNYERLFQEKLSLNSVTYTANNVKIRKLNRSIGINRLFRYRRRFLWIAVLIFVIFSFFTTSGYLCTYPFCAGSNTKYLFGFEQASSLSIKTETDIDYLSSTKQAIDAILISKFGHSYDNYELRKKIIHDTVAFQQIHDSLNKIVPFNLHGNDVIVFLHMQKTGGSSFDRHLTRDLQLEQSCKCEARKNKKCRCFRPNKPGQYWLFSRYSIGWRCGLHADYTELINCVDRVLQQSENNSTVNTNSLAIEQNVPNTNNDGVSLSRHTKRYFYITLLREPISRFISEYKHVQRGATWKTSRHWCGGRLPTIRELPSCFEGQNWKGVQINEFLDCKNNLAFNRQTRMLADLNLVNCYNHSLLSDTERDAILLHSAKKNLESMAFFGLCEEQLATQYVFERTFNLKFKKSFVQFNQTRSIAEQKYLPPETIDTIRRLNHLDMKLYSYAKDLFFQRFNRLKNNDPNFAQNWSKMVENSNNQTVKAPIKVRTTNDLFDNSLYDKDKEMFDGDSATLYDDKAFNSLEDYYSL